MPKSPNWRHLTWINLLRKALFPQRLWLLIPKQCPSRSTPIKMEVSHLLTPCSCVQILHFLMLHYIMKNFVHMCVACFPLMCISNRKKLKGLFCADFTFFSFCLAAVVNHNGRKHNFLHDSMFCILYSRKEMNKVPETITYYKKLKFSLSVSPRCQLIRKAL
jgi:hypothetical protein